MNITVQYFEVACNVFSYVFAKILLVNHIVPFFSSVILLLSHDENTDFQMTISVLLMVIMMIIMMIIVTIMAIMLITIIMKMMSDLW